MPGRLVLDQKFVKRIALSVAMSAALLLLAGVGTARADDYTKCQDKLQVAQTRLFRDIHRHGEYSHQARSDQNKLNDAQNWCSSHHVFSEQGRSFRNGRPYPGGNQGAYNRDNSAKSPARGALPPDDAYRDPRNNGPNYGPYNGPNGRYH
jgi:hypothetical protein